MMCALHDKLVLFLVVLLGFSTNLTESYKNHPSHPSRTSKVSRKVKDAKADQSARLLGKGGATKKFRVMNQSLSRIEDSNGGFSR
jgi:hypothetical protein